MGLLKSAGDLSYALHKWHAKPSITQMVGGIAKLKITALDLIADWAKYDAKKERDDRLADDWRWVCNFYKALKEGKEVFITYDGEKTKLTMEMLMDMATSIVKERLDRGFDFHPGNMERDSLELYNKVLDRMGKEANLAERQGDPLKDFEYLLHHIEIDDQGKEQIHHCYLYDHIANLFEQDHLLVKDGRTYLNGKEITNGLFHIIKGLEPTQENVWSDKEAIEGEIKPKKMKAGMTLKGKAGEW